MPNASGTWGTYYKPFSADSPWNSRPVNPVFGTFEIPKDSYFPAISSGAYSTGLFLAKESDSPMTIQGLDARGVWDPDAGTYGPVTIPRWPADVLPASGNDGHADIYDPVTGIIHSFWILKMVNGQWVAAQHAWTPVKGSGFGIPGHHYQGARAVGVAASAGIIRKHEVKDGNAVYKHALAMSLTFSGLSPGYIFPATTADYGNEKNYGKIPEGALLMLPPSFDTSKIANADLKKIADTLKTYGAYVVDRNTGTPYAIYVENGSDFNLMPKGWDNTIASQLDQIRAALRQVVSATEWRDGNESSMSALNQNFNAFSMRGPWQVTSTGTAAGAYDTIAQAVEFPASSQQIIQRNTNGTGLYNVTWGKRLPNSKQRFTVHATGEASMRLDVWVGSGVVYSTGNIGDGVVKEFTWPASGGWITVTAASGLNQPSSVGAKLIMIP
ncbi:MAG: Atrophin-1 multi-domain protein [Bdellovibrio sp.]|nr:Atrophin-1 multi-domain protein [Bdellovibrio sp.]